MEAFYVPSEVDFKRWVKEAVQEYLQVALLQTPATQESPHDLMNRKEAAKLLQVSLVTLTDWMKRGLPFHKQRGRVYFIKSEVLNYIRASQSTKVPFLSKTNHLGC